MSLVPEKIVDRIQFFENHTGPFSTNAVAIGITTTEATDLQTKTAAARAAFDARQAAQQAAEAATLAMYDAVEAMSVAGQALIDKIRAKAKQVGGNSVYTLSELPPPATPTTVGNPGTPSALKVELKPNGSIGLAWDCSNPPGCTGVLYHVYRQIEAVGDFTFIGGSGNRKFVDASLPMGTQTVVYKIQGVRTTSMGDEAEFIVRFGTTASGDVMTTVTAKSAEPKLAA
jgi:hypothetical protein